MKKLPTITKQLEEKFGGKWKYLRVGFPNGIWKSEEKNARAYYVATGGYDLNGEYVPSLFPILYVYGLGNPPKRFTPDQSYIKSLKKNINNMWNSIEVQPPNEFVKVMDENGNTAFAEPTYYPFKVGESKGGKWTSPVIPCNHYWDGGWLIQSEGL